MIAHQHQRSRSAYNNLPPTPTTTTTSSDPFTTRPVLHHSPTSQHPLPSLPVDDHHHHQQHQQPTMAPLQELQRNDQDVRKHRFEPAAHKAADRGRSESPVKSSKFAFPGTKRSKSRDPNAVKKQKSGTNLVGLLSRPKSLKGLYKLATEEAQKENASPQEVQSAAAAAAAPTPIYAQFASDQSVRRDRERASVEVERSGSMAPPARPGMKPRPQSFQVPMHKGPSSSSLALNKKSSEESSRKDSSDKPPRTQNRMRDAISTFTHRRNQSEASTPQGSESSRTQQQKQQQQGKEKVLDPKDIDKHLEAMLDRRNIPENQRYKMRNLNDTIKMEFIRQDWAEMAAKRPGSADEVVVGGDGGGEGESEEGRGRKGKEDKSKRTRGRSFTFSRGKKDSTKGKRELSIGRHLRSRSTDSIASERPGSSASMGDSSNSNNNGNQASSGGSSLLSKMKIHQGPADYVAYLRKVPEPEKVEVGKLHKLRLLLRNETVSWIEEFIGAGGMKEIVGLLGRIMDVEWREEHEDALLHENLLCLKALSTTARGMQYLDTIHNPLFPNLLAMLFDPERKGPSEFTTRNIITSILFAYIQSATLEVDRTMRAERIARYLRDPEPKDEERPLPFVMEMRRSRPYRVWNKEIVSVTKEVFWIFLHNLNVIALPPPVSEFESGERSYMQKHFPSERPPVAAAPYVGGVEWDATNYLASHLDLMNAIVACTPTMTARMELREQLKISGMERVMGGSLRLCKEKFYACVHDGLRTWVGAGWEDGWEVRDVRYGPAPESRSQSPRKKPVGGGRVEGEVKAPKIEMPRLEFEKGKGDEWL